MNLEAICGVCNLNEREERMNEVVEANEEIEGIYRRFWGVIPIC